MRKIIIVAPDTAANVAEAQAAVLGCTEIAFGVPPRLQGIANVGNAIVEDDRGTVTVVTAPTAASVSAAVQPPPPPPPDPEFERIEQLLQAAEAGTATAVEVREAVAKFMRRAIRQGVIRRAG